MNRSDTQGHRPCDAAETRRGPDEGVPGGDGEPPPFLGSWPRVYLLVLGWLALLIGLMALFTRIFT